MSGFADLPVDYDQTIHELESGWLSRPQALRGRKALYIAGHNRSDELFMFWKQKITGLRPNTAYRMRAAVRFVSQYHSGLFGIGGSPADSVFVKIGASKAEPVATEDDSGQLLLNIEKGHQAQGGASASTAGTVALPERGVDEYGYVLRNNFGKPVSVTTDETGSLWVFFGTDSGFEGKTELWFTRLWVKFQPQRR